MRPFTNIILGVIKLALTIGLAGGLTDMTLAMRSEVVKVHRAGLVSLKQLNSKLLNENYFESDSFVNKNTDIESTESHGRRKPLVHQCRRRRI